MKKVISLVLALTLAVSIFVIAPVSADAATSTTNYGLEIGKSYTRTVQNESDFFKYMYVDNSHDYTFTMSKSSNVTVSLSTTSTSIQWQVRGTDYGSTYATQNGSASGTYYFAKGKTYIVRVSAVGQGGGGKYTLSTAYAAPDKISLKKKAGRFGSGKKTVVATYKGTGDYIMDNFKVKNKNKKVATMTYSFVQGNKINLEVTPIRLGKTVFTLKVKGSNSVKYTAHVTKAYWFVAKGSKAKAPKPLGVSKPTWKSTNKKVAAINKKTGKIKAKKGGRTSLIAKKGKISYKLTTVVTDYIKLGKKTYHDVKNVVNNPEKLKVYNVYKGYSKQIYDGFKVPVVLLDYGSTNENGAMVRSKVLAYYDDVHEVRFASGWNEENIIGKKRMSASSIK